MENVPVLKWQTEAIEAMQKGEKVDLTRLPRAAGRNYLQNLLKTDYPELYKKYYLEPIEKDNWLKANVIIIDEAAPKGFNPFWKNKQLKDFKF